MYLDILEPVLLIGGCLVFLTSIVLFLRRTGNVKAVMMFWQADMVLTHKEFLMNRIGITIMFMGIVLRFFNHW
ncbi:MAG: hypothetical protein OQK12_09240 [Motiliproteus sp.]|nr:hypothetical protein [Motiliproteus sp.]MCW9052288.1 hypothetical protein [Motiliproteus sp.]